MTMTTNSSFDTGEPVEGAPRSLPGVLSLLPRAFTNPREYFRLACGSRSKALPLLFVVIVGIIHGVLRGLLLHSPMSMLAVPLFAVVYGLVVGLGVHLAGRSLGGKGEYADGLAVACYAGVAGLLSWIPAIGFLFVIWGVYLALTGMSVCYGVSRACSGLSELYKAGAILWTAFALASGVYGLAMGQPAASSSLNQWVAMRLLVWFLAFICLAVLSIISDTGKPKEA